jgi:hypothetical protein
MLPPLVIVGKITKLPKICFDFNAPGAWELSTGSSENVVAIIEKVGS